MVASFETSLALPGLPDDVFGPFVFFNLAACRAAANPDIGSMLSERWRFGAGGGGGGGCWGSWRSSWGLWRSRRSRRRSWCRGGWRSWWRLVSLVWLLLLVTIILGLLLLAIVVGLGSGTSVVLVLVGSVILRGGSVLLVGGLRGHRGR